MANTRSNRHGQVVVSGVALAMLAGTVTAFGQSATPAPSKAPAASPAPTTPAQPETAVQGSTKPAGKVAPVRTPGVHNDNASNDNQGENVAVDDNLVVDLHVNDEDLGNVLEMLSIQSQKNIIASKNVQARVTANLYGVTFYEALDAILHANGYGFKEEGNFIYVYTLEELEAIEAASKTRTAKVVKLNYLNAVDAAEFVKPLLSDGGQIKTNGKTGTFSGLGDTPVGADEYVHGATMVVVDFEENIAEIEAMIAQLDTKPSQVLVEATILQTSLNEENAMGVDFSIVGSVNFSDFFKWGGPLQAANAVANGRTEPGAGAGTPLPGANSDATAISSTVGNTASGKSTLKVGVVSDDVAVFLRVLDEVTDTTILSNPKVMALNRMPSRVLVGRKVGYVSTTSTDTATTQTVQFLDTGTQLYFRPFVTNDGLVRMELKPQVSEAAIREVQSANGSAITIPDEVTNELTTNVIVGDGQTIVLGGLFRESIETTRRQVPLLGDIPIVGYAFRGNDDTNKRAEIIFLVTPTIMNDAAANAAGQRGMEYSERARAGARAGTLFFSRERLSGNWNIEAEKAAARGDTSAAQWQLKKSLHINPAQPEAIRLKEQLDGKRRDFHNRSMLDRTIRGEASKKSANTTNTNAPAQEGGSTLTFQQP